MRGLSKGFAEGRLGEEVLEAVRRGLAMPEAEIPVVPQPLDLPRGIGPIGLRAGELPEEIRRLLNALTAERAP